VTEIIAAFIGSLVTGIPLYLKLRQVSKAQPKTIIQRLDAQDKRFEAIETRLSQHEALLSKIRDVLHEIEIVLARNQNVEVAPKESELSDFV
jgi:hypothetical protein